MRRGGPELLRPLTSASVRVRVSERRFTTAMQQPLRNFAKSLGVYLVDCAMRRWGVMPRGSLMRAVARGGSILLLAVLPFAGQSTQPIPVFSRESIGAVGRIAKVLAPGMVLMLYGGHLAPEPVCGQPAVQPALELYGVRVLIDTAPAELLYVSSGQINFKIPPDVPMEGFAPLRVCVGAACSTPVPMWFSTRTALISLEKPAYVHIPVWIRVDPPPPYSVLYPCWNGPWMPSGYEFEVRRNGRFLAPMPQPSSPPTRGEPARSGATAQQPGVRFRSTFCTGSMSRGRTLCDSRPRRRIGFFTGRSGPTSSLARSLKRSATRGSSPWTQRSR